MKMCSRSVVVAMSAMLAASTALADETEVSTESAKATEESTKILTEPASQSTNAVRVVRDKKTGKLRAPNPAELRKMAEMEEAAQSVQTTSPAGMPAQTVIREHADGMKSAQLSAEYLMSLYGERGEDGTIRKSHSNDGEDQVSDEEYPTE